MATDPKFSPTGVHAPHGARELVMSFADGKKLRYPHRILRGFCPCAGCQGHGGTLTFQEPGNLEIREVGQVGNYALSLRWGDGHDGGIYSFQYLRRLGELLEEKGAEALEAARELPRT